VKLIFGNKKGHRVVTLGGGNTIKFVVYGMI